MKYRFVETLWGVAFESRRRAVSRRLVRIVAREDMSSITFSVTVKLQKAPITFDHPRKKVVLLRAMHVSFEIHWLTLMYGFFVSFFDGVIKVGRDDTAFGKAREVL